MQVEWAKLIRVQGALVDQNQPFTSSSVDDRDIEGIRFAEIIQYAQIVLGGREDRRASQRELSSRLNVAATMIGRYKSGLCDWRNIKASTIEALAKAAQLEVGTLFVWINEGREAALAHERKTSTTPRAFAPVDLARELVAMLETGSGLPDKDEALPSVEPDQPRIYTEEDAKRISQMCRDAFRRIATDQLLAPREAWEKLKPLCEEMNAAEISRFREVVSGWEEWSAEEVNQLLVGGKLDKPSQALDRLGGKLMLPLP